jgi:nucleoside-diphosphate-sugar epimerase
LASPNFDYCKEGVLRAGIVDLTKQIIKKLPTYECKKFIYFSSAKVYGEPAFNDNSFSEQSLLNPLTDYAKAKADAEELIQLSANKNEFKYIIYRLPMVYGPNMKSNISRLLALVNSSMPFFYFKATNNYKKSLLSIENIKRIISYNIKTPSSINNQILNIADSEPLSLNEIIFEYKKICLSKSIIFPLPNFLFKALSNVSIFKKLYGGFEVNNNKLKNNSQLNIMNISEGLALLNVSMHKDE